MSRCPCQQGARNPITSGTSNEANVSSNRNKPSGVYPSVENLGPCCGPQPCGMSGCPIPKADPPSAYSLHCPEPGSTTCAAPGSGPGAGSGQGSGPGSGSGSGPGSGPRSGPDSGPGSGNKPRNAADKGNEQPKNANSGDLDDGSGLNLNSTSWSLLKAVLVFCFGLFLTKKMTNVASEVY